MQLIDECINRNILNAHDHVLSRSFRVADRSLKLIQLQYLSSIDALKQIASTTLYNETLRWDNDTRDMRGSGVKSGKGPEGRVMYL